MEKGRGRNGAAFGPAGAAPRPAVAAAAGAGAAPGEPPGPLCWLPWDLGGGAGDDGVHLPQVSTTADAATRAFGRPPSQARPAQGPGYRSHQDPASLRPLQGHPQCPSWPRPLQLPAVRRGPGCRPFQASTVLPHGLLLPRRLPWVSTCPARGDQ